MPEMKSWLAYNNGTWSVDRACSQRMHKTVRSIIEEGARNIDDQDALLRWRKRSEDNARLRAATDIASTLEGLVKPVSELDTKPNLLNLPNGTMELKTQTFRDHRSNDYLTCKTNGSFLPSAEAPRWREFISEVTGGNVDDGRYLQKFCGYTLLSQRREQIILFLIGDGGDGKSVFIETLKHVLGAYQTTLAPSSISASHKSSIPNDLARLRGKRLVTISELPKDLHIDTQVVKGLSGGDTMTARFLHQEYLTLSRKLKC